MPKINTRKSKTKKALTLKLKEKIMADYSWGIKRNQILRKYQITDNQFVSIVKYSIYKENKKTTPQYMQDEYKS
ncbi:MAG TPA: hypothetical protein VII99_16535 [Bacteroidia bacterium]